MLFPVHLKKKKANLRVNGEYRRSLDSDFSHEIKDTCSLEESSDKPRQRIKKQRHHLANIGRTVKAMVFSSSHVQVWELGHKKAECWRVDAFKLWCWKSLLRVPWTARRSNLKEISLEYSLKGLMVKLKLQYFGHLMHRANSLEKTPVLGKIEGKRRRGAAEAGWLESITNSVDTYLRKLREIWRTKEPGVLQSMRSERVGHNLVTEQQGGCRDKLRQLHCLSVVLETKSKSST